MVRGRDLIERGYPAGRIVGLALEAAERASASANDSSPLDDLVAVRDAPEAFLEDPRYAEVAREWLRLRGAERGAGAEGADALRDEPLPFEVFGEEMIEEGARRQMRDAMRLPVSVGGALMPDSHQGYGLPIGGVLATEGVVIPYAVGVDIAPLRGDTPIPTLDGRSYPIKELCEREEEFGVWSCEPDGRVVAAKARAFRTERDAPLIRVTLDNGRVVECTPDHRFMLRDGAYVEAGKLVPGTSLMPFHSGTDKEGYMRIQQNYSGALLRANIYNHKVAAVEELPEREDVYCLEVPDHHNFAVGAGVFVHNCRMRMTVFDVSAHVLGQKRAALTEALLRNTNFGAGGKYKPGRRGAEHEVLDDPAWEATPFLRKLKDTAHAQLGTSGSGNHFVEWGAFEAFEDVTLPSGGTVRKGERRLALLSHSGSRGVGARIADRYTKIAKSKHPSLEGNAADLAWLSLSSEEGAEYWLSMNLAGRFAAANHAVIHEKLSRALREVLGGEEKEAVSWENHHNFSWRETVRHRSTDEREVIVHRKGATPAGSGVMGVIPGSMGDAGYVVRGKGNAHSLNSASHGAGRLMSRKKAFEAITDEELKAYLERKGVTLIGGSRDEAPQAYKRIEEVLAAQADLVDLIGSFTPAIVRMDEAAKPRWMRNKKR